MLKRLFDIVLSFFGLLILMPVLCIVIICVALFLGRPVFFIQERPGLNSKPFYILKFRTMKDLRDGAGDLLPDEDRISRFGNFLRKYSIDELPELINVLKGDMSLVGPRPLLMQYLPLYSDEQIRRHDVKPGITGWAQINGRNAVGWNERFELDLWYVKNQSVMVDLKILLLTVKKVIIAENINSENHVTMEPFRGGESESEI